MVVLVIVVLMSVVVVVSMSPALSDARLRSGSRLVVSMLKYARSYAVAHQTEARVAFDLQENGLVVEAAALDDKDEKVLTPVTTSVGRYRRLPNGLSIAAIEKPGTDEQESYIAFTEVGKSETATVVIRDTKERQRRITVDAITGRCEIEPDVGNAYPTSDTRTPQ